MSISVKVSGAWRTVSQPHIRVGGVYRAAKAMYVREGWPNRYDARCVPPQYLGFPGSWIPAPYAGYTQSQPAPTAEAGAVRMTWTADGTNQLFRGVACTVSGGRSHTISLTCTQAPAGVPWRVHTPYYESGTEVIGPGTSTLTFTPTSGTGTYIGILTDAGAVGTAGHLVSNLTVTPANPVTTVPNNGVVFPWRQAWPNPNTGALEIVGVRKEFGYSIYGWSSEGIYATKLGEPSVFNGRFGLPLVPYYRIKGDTSQIASAKVTLRFTPIAPKSPVEHTISWEAPVGWGLYHVMYQSATDGYFKYYYTALTDAEATTLKADASQVVTQLWSPKEGGWFVWMPVCWDTSGVTVPMRPEGSQTSDGLDPYSGYTPFPPNRSATSVLADYTVANGYTDMKNNDIVYSAITIELKNSGGTVIASWSGSLAAGNTPDQPGKGNTVTRMARVQAVLNKDFYWPVEWRGLFDNFADFMPSKPIVRFNKDVHTGAGEWIVYDEQGERIGDFRLALRKGVTDTVEIHGVNLKPDLIGMSIMRSIVHHGTIWCPTRFVVVEPPNKPTYDVMRSWGWQKLEEASAKSSSYLFYRKFDLLAKDKYLIYDTHVPMYNRFSELGFPSLDEVAEW
jgi:hypothetical protein